MAEIAEMHIQAYRYLRAIPAHVWTLSHARAPRFGVVTSNMSESSNSWILDEREIEPFEAVVHLVRKTGRLFFERRQIYSTMEASIPPNIMKILKDRVQEGRTRHVVRTGEHAFDVGPRNNGSFRVVNLQLRTCSCGVFQQEGLPCLHACAAALRSNQAVEDLVVPSYTTRALRALYGEDVYNVDVDLVEVDPTILPPPEIKQAGRPKKRRLRTRGETDPENQLSCSLCHQKGHNKRTCAHR